LGEHTEEVMKNVLGMDAQEIQELISSEVIKGK
jgi:crotonobetainyl-CoA:carnitine CoA-transferase CaiB-like acyl-CoA transferase